MTTLMKRYICVAMIAAPLFTTSASAGDRGGGTNWGAVVGAGILGGMLGAAAAPAPQPQIIVVVPQATPAPQPMPVSPARLACEYRPVGFFRDPDLTCVPGTNPSWVCRIAAAPICSDYRQTLTRASKTANNPIFWAWCTDYQQFFPAAPSCPSGFHRVVMQ